MFHHITDDCIRCDACPRECPVGAIVPGPRKYLIREDACLDCGACVQVCPTEAIACTARNLDEVIDAWGQRLNEPHPASG